MFIPGWNKSAKQHPSQKKSLNGSLLLALSVVLCLSGLQSGCGRIRQGSQHDANDLKIDMATEPTKPAVGPGRLIFTLRDDADHPIDSAALNIEGNMSHAGMVPVFAQTTGGENGRYVVPFKWTMAGDWILTVDVSLADGRVVSGQFLVVVVDDSAAGDADE